MEDIQDVRDWLISNAEYDEEEVNHMSSHDLFESWLAAKDVYNITDEIIEVVSAIYDIDL